MPDKYLQVSTGSGLSLLDPQYVHDCNGKTAGQNCSVNCSSTASSAAAAGWTGVGQQFYCSAGTFAGSLPSCTPVPVSAEREAEAEISASSVATIIIACVVFLCCLGAGILATYFVIRRRKRQMPPDAVDESVPARGASFVLEVNDNPLIDDSAANAIDAAAEAAIAGTAEASQPQVSRLNIDMSAESFALTAANPQPPIASPRSVASLPNVDLNRAGNTSPHSATSSMPSLDVPTDVPNAPNTTADGQALNNALRMASDMASQPPPPVADRPVAMARPDEWLPPAQELLLLGQGAIQEV